MALGRRQRERQEALFVSHEELAEAPGHPFYQRLAQLLTKHDFDAFCEELCAPFYAAALGRPGLAPGNYFRLLFIGYFERLESERQIAWRVADSLSLRQFLGLGLTAATPDHSTISGTRRRLDLACHQAAFGKVLAILAAEGLLKGRTLGVDATSLAANASMKNLRGRFSGKSYRRYVKDLMKQDPNAPNEPTDDEIARYDRQRKDKKLSNEDWHNPHNPEAKIGRMKDGRTRFIEKCEQAVDLDSGAVVGVTVQDASTGDTDSLPETLIAATENLNRVKDHIRQRQAGEPRPAGPPPSRDLAAELVADKGYHSAATCRLLADLDFRGYLSEPARGRQNWQGKEAEREAVYANRRRLRGDRGKRLLRRRGELCERPFAHYLDHGGMRRVHLKGHDNIAKRLLAHVAGFNLGLVMRQTLGTGTPRALAALHAFFAPIYALLAALLRHYPAPSRTQRPATLPIPITNNNQHAA